MWEATHTAVLSCITHNMLCPACVRVTALCINLPTTAPFCLTVVVFCTELQSGCVLCPGVGFAVLLLHTFASECAAVCPLSAEAAAPGSPLVVIVCLADSQAASCTSDQPAWVVRWHTAAVLPQLPHCTG